MATLSPSRFLKKGQVQLRLPLRLRKLLRSANHCPAGPSWQRPTRRWSESRRSLVNSGLLQSKVSTLEVSSAAHWGTSKCQASDIHRAGYVSRARRVRRFGKPNAIGSMTQSCDSFQAAVVLCLGLVLDVLANGQCLTEPGVGDSHTFLPQICFVHSKVTCYQRRSTMISVQFGRSGGRKFHKYKHHALALECASSPFSPYLFIFFFSFFPFSSCLSFLPFLFLCV